MEDIRGALQSRINDRSASIGVIGLGYVGTSNVHRARISIDYAKSSTCFLEISRDGEATGKHVPRDQYWYGE